MKDLIQTGDWKGEKHVPSIDIIGAPRKGERIELKVGVGKEIPHPNTTEHHISWIEVYFHPEGEKFPYLLGRFEFSSHGESTQGPNTSTVYSEPWISLFFKAEKSGTIHALSYCNIHGLWGNSAPLKIEG